MSHSPVYVSDAVARFYDNYLICLDKASVPEKQRRWYVKRVEAFITVQNRCRIEGKKGVIILGTDPLLSHKLWI